MVAGVCACLQRQRDPFSFYDDDDDDDDGTSFGYKFRIHIKVGGAAGRGAGHPSQQYIGPHQAPATVCDFFAAASPPLQILLVAMAMLLG